MNTTYFYNLGYKHAHLQIKRVYGWMFGTNTANLQQFEKTLACNSYFKGYYDYIREYQPENAPEYFEFWDKR